MENRIIKKNERCPAEDCASCYQCAQLKNDEVKKLPEIGTKSELYGKEIDHYYFYYLENKAS